jgi:hypothetical protein
MNERLKDIRTVIVALLVTAVLAVAADQLYFSDLEWKFRTAHLDSRLSGLEEQAALLLQDVDS